MSHNLSELSERFQAFNRARDWGKFHSPKNVLLSLISEVGELSEHFRWRDGDELSAYVQDPVSREKVKLELGDVFLNILLFSQSVGIDLVDAGEAALEKNARNYPEDAARGQHKKLKNGDAA